MSFVINAQTSSLKQEDNSHLFFDHRTLEFTNRKAPFVQVSKKLKTVHQLYFLESDSLVDAFKVVQIPVQLQNDLQNFQANFRTEDADSMQALSIDSMVFDGVQFHIYLALEEVGFLELRYTLAQEPNAYGREVFQQNLPIDRASLTIKSNGLAFKVKGYNGLQMSTTKSNLKRHAYEGKFRNIPAFKDEAYATNEANKMYVEYAAKALNWQTLSEVVVGNSTAVSRKVRKRLQQILEREVEVFKYKTRLEKVAAIEKFVERNFELIDEANQSDLKKVLQTKTLNETGLIYLYAALFKQANIYFELVGTTSKYQWQIEEDFPSPFNLNYFLFYFSREKTFFTPYDFTYQLGQIPPYLIGQEGFSIAGNSNVLNGIHSVYRFVEVLQQEQQVNEQVDLFKFDVTQSNKLTIKRTLKGYPAIDFVNKLNATDEEGRSELLLGAENSTNKIAINDEVGIEKIASGEALIIEADATTENLIQHKDDTTILKLGALIGEQMFLQDSIRHQSIVLDYPMTYKRQFEITLNGQQVVFPKNGYSKLVNQGNPDLYFELHVHQQGEKLIIDVEEVYGQDKYPILNYDAFRNVVNAAYELEKLEVILVH